MWVLWWDGPHLSQSTKRRLSLRSFTPWKINMEPKNHPFRKENDLNQTSMIMFHVNLQGCKAKNNPTILVLTMWSLNSWSLGDDRKWFVQGEELFYLGLEDFICYSFIFYSGLCCIYFVFYHMDVSKNRGKTPKWIMVKRMVPNPIKHGMIWGYPNPLFLGQHPYYEKLDLYAISLPFRITGSIREEPRFFLHSMTLALPEEVPIKHKKAERENTVNFWSVRCLVCFDGKKSSKFYVLCWVTLKRRRNMYRCHVVFKNVW